MMPCPSAAPPCVLLQILLSAADLARRAEPPEDRGRVPLVRWRRWVPLSLHSCEAPVAGG
jgi:hypothetical protein